MEVFVHRNPIGCETFDLEDIKELEEQLSSFGVLRPLDDKAEVLIEITGTWGQIRELLSQPCFKDIWFDPQRSPLAHVEAAEKCTDENPCCERRGEYNGYHSGSLLFECPKHCSCHD